MKGKIFKKLLTVVMLLVMTLTIIPSVFAAINTDTKGSLTVESLETTQQINVDIYRIMTVNIEGNQPKSPVYTWIPAVAEWLKSDANKEKYGQFINESNNAVTDKFSTKNSALTAKVLADFYDDLAAAIKSGSLNVTAISKSTTQTSENPKTYSSSVNFEGLELGNYFILVNNGIRVYKPTSVNIVPEWKNNDWNVDAANVDVTVKSTTPGVVKTVKNGNNYTNASQKNIGDTVDFKLEVTVPQYPEDATKKTFKINDTFSNGLTFNGVDTIEITAIKEDGTKTTLTSDDYSASTNGQKLTIDFSNTYDRLNLEEYKTLEVTYSATLNENAVVTDGEENTANITFNNNPYGDNDYDTDEVKVDVYTYGLDLTKVDGDVAERTKLIGAEFKISRTKGGEALEFVGEGNGVYRLAKTGDQQKTTTLVVGENGDNKGKLVVRGLSVGDYYVTETKAPAEYNKLPDALTFTITDEDVNGKIDSKENEEIVNTESGYLFNEIENTKGFVLPVTGGIGTLIFSIIGIVFMGTSVVLVRNILKKNEA